VDNITYIINRDLFNSVKPIEVDWKQSIFGSGFVISSKLSRGLSCNNNICSY